MNHILLISPENFLTFNFFQNLFIQNQQLDLSINFFWIPFFI